MTMDFLSIVGKLRAGIPPRRILADIRQNAPPTNKERIHYAEMSDLYII